MIMTARAAANNSQIFIFVSSVSAHVLQCFPSGQRILRLRILPALARPRTAPVSFIPEQPDKACIDLHTYIEP